VPSAFEGPVVGTWPFVPTLAAMDRRETEHLLESIRSARASDEPVAIATVVRVRGSAYRREGTRMVIRRDGTYECALSGGCLEPIVAEAAERVIASGEPVVINYDLADDSIWGLGIGCSGAVDVRIERLDDDDTTRRWWASLERGDAAVLVTPLTEGKGEPSSGKAKRMLVLPTGDTIGTLGNDSIDREAARRALEKLGAPDATPSSEWVGEDELFFEFSTPAPELVIFGAGFDAVPMASLAWTLGFTVTVVDVREAFLTAGRFPHARLVAAHFSHFSQKVRLAGHSFALVMNHHLERDQESLRFALGSDAVYIGVLGPRVRLQTLLARLAGQEFAPSPAALARVRSPVGVALGAETPAEIAVSVLGEIMAIRRGFSGGFLNGSAATLHKSADRRLLASS
jgi:xanthine dehydrogenase accessory factor